MAVASGINSADVDKDVATRELNQELQDKGINGSVLKAFMHGFWSFIKHYVFKLGFLDGGAGFIIAFGNFEGTFYRYIKLTEVQKNWNPPKTKPIYKN